MFGGALFDRGVAVATSVLLLCPAQDPCSQAPVSHFERQPVQIRRQVTVPTGTRLRIVLRQTVSTETSRVGDVFSAVLAERVIVNGETVIPKGTPVAGQVVDIVRFQRSRPRVTLVLRELEVIDGGRTVSVRVETEPHRERMELAKYLLLGIPAAAAYVAADLLCRHYDDGTASNEGVGLFCVVPVMAGTIAGVAWAIDLFPRLSVVLSPGTAREFRLLSDVTIEMN